MSARTAATATSTRSGSALVVGIVGITLTALGVGTVYLPFVADKDKIRGMSEEGGGAASAVGRIEYERAIREMSLAAGGLGGGGGGGGVDADVVRQQMQMQNSQPPPRNSNSNSMWERLNQAARSPSKRSGKD